MSGLYIHFPWCVKKCPYCDFNSHPVRGSLDQATYVDALLADLRSQGEHLPAQFTSVFLGGGTPSLFTPEALAPLFQALRDRISADTEVTMEANPGSQEHWDFAGYRALGVNRLSIGAQSFDPTQLTRLGRIHSAADTAKALHSARDGGFDSINLDLMYALPEQRLDEAMSDLQQAFELAPEHISWYQLTIEAKTEFARRPPVLPDESVSVDIEEAGLQALASAGYERYEISAYAANGQRCAHNLNYWRFGNYVGIGAGAHGKLRSTQGWQRTRKASQPRLYQEQPGQTDTVPVAVQDIAGEIAMNVLRLIDGLSSAELEALLRELPADTMAAVQTQLTTRWQSAIAQGLMREDRFGATELGQRYLDTLVAEFLAG